MLRVDCVKLGMIKTNSYIIGDNEKCIIVDIGDDSKTGRQELEKNIGNRELVGIVFTHSHFDHIMGSCLFPEVQQYMSEVDFNLIEEHQRLSSYVVNILATKPVNINFLDENMNISGISFRAINTPGHTKGGVCLVFDDFVITGDTLFSGCCGRLDVGGNYNDMKSSLNTLSKLNSDLIIYPGHGKSSILKDELKWMEDF